MDLWTDYYVLNVIQYHSTMDFLFIELQIDQYRLLVGIFYR